ncbi:hypothetical protein HMPREF0669_01979 (plasmid) [Prevotella sp. oral taxon 299 str. F0039]|nr:hypothetical protein HMPREF0669_01979 [Prevotella sp. oral taxon 299 str. F0039]
MKEKGLACSQIIKINTLHFYYILRSPNIYYIKVIRLKNIKNKNHLLKNSLLPL